MFKKILYLLLLIFFIGSCKKDTTPLPTLQNVTGTWQVISYIKNGTASKTSEIENNFFMFNNNYTYSARVGSGSKEIFFFGTMKIDGKNIIISEINNPDMALAVNQISINNLGFKTSTGNETYEFVLSKVSSPTLYKIQNKTGATLSFSTFYFDSEVRDYAFHGSIVGGSISSNKVFTKRDRILMGIDLAGHYFFSKYAQMIHPGQENTIILADTTTVFQAQSNTSLLPSLQKLKSGDLKLTRIQDILSKSGETIN
jgi:hypothetical protein